MIRALVTLACALVISSSALADTVRVRSGEHPDFTRLVFEFSALPDWQAGRVKDGYEIAFKGNGALTADLERAFALIRRDRVAEIDVEAEQRRITIVLACTCNADIFTVRSNALVIDIRDGAPDETDKFEDVLPVPKATQPKALSNAPALNAPVIHNADAPRYLPLYDEPHLAQTDVPPLRTSTQKADRPPAIPLSDRVRPTSSASLDLTDIGATIDSNAVSAVADQLSRAIAQGLLEPFEPQQGLPAASDTSPVNISGPANFLATTRLDRDLNATDVSVEATSSGAQCISNRYIAFEKWGDPDDLSYLGKLRRKAIAENGAVTQEGMRDLARFYLLLGFGSEAQALARQISPGVDRDIILALGDIIDQGYSDAPILDGQIACAGEVSLWAALAQPFGADEIPTSTDAILKSFSALPRHLRTHLGPTLSERLRQAGAPTSARAALNAVTRAGSGTARQDLTSARLGLTGTAAGQSRTALETLSQGTDFTAAEALLELLNDSRRRQVAPKPEWVDDAATLVRAIRGTELGERLSIAALQGHVPLGRFDALRRTLNTSVPGLNDSVRRNLSVEALTAAVAEADDIAFLRSEIGFSRFAKPQFLSVDAKYNVAARLLSLDLPQIALKYLENAPETERFSHLSAKVYTRLMRPDTAQRQIEDLNTTGIAATRATIFDAIGQRKQAATQYALADQPVLATRRALQSGDWEWAASNLPTNVRDTLLTLTTPNDPATDSENAALIESVSNRREAVRNLLELSKIEGEP